MNKREAAKQRICLCCGKPNALLLRLNDGRAIRVCHDCMTRCGNCRDAGWTAGVERGPIGAENSRIPIDNV